MDQEILERIAEIALSYYALSERMDWDDLLYRAESDLGIDLPENMLDPKIIEIKKYMNRARREAREN